MSRKIISAALLLVCAGVLWLVLGAPGNPTLSRCSLPEGELDAIRTDRAETEAELVSDIRFNDYALSYDRPTGRWFYSLIEGSPTAADPQVSITAAPGVTIAFEACPITEEGIRNNESIRLLAYTDTEYREYTLVCTTLPVLELYTSEPIGTEDATVQVRLFDNRAGAVSRVTTSRADAHIRGNLSTWYPKKGYKLSLITDSLGNNLRNNDLSLLGMRQDNDWILNAVYNDQDRVRQAFSAALWADGCGSNNLWGLENSNSYAYVELFCNDEYQGLYLLGYPIDRLQLGINAANQPTEYLYKRVSYEIPTPDNLYGAEGVPSFTYGGSSLAPAGDLAADSDWEALRSYYEVLLAPNFDIWKLYGITDRDNLIDAYLFVLMIQGVDNCGKNYYISAKNWEGQTRYLFTPWDFDFSWGNTYDGEDPNFTACTVGPEANLCFEPAAPLLDYDLEGIAPLILERYQQLRQGPWSDEAMAARLAEFEEMIFRSGAYARDTARWPDSTQADRTDLSAFRAIVEARMAYLDAYIADTFG